MSRDSESFAAEYFLTRRALADNASRSERLSQLRDASAHEQLDDLVHGQPAEAWDLILMLVERAADEEDLAYIAAGPIEDLIRLHARTFAPRIAAEAGSNPRFRSALNYVWGWDALPDDIWAELRPSLAPDVGAHWDAARASGGRGKRRTTAPWRPPQPRPKSERFT